MKQVYAHPQLVMVNQMRSLLEQAGIASQLRNEYAAGAVGELAPIDAWPELWVTREQDFDQAQQLIAQLSAQDNQPDWECGNCASPCPASFEFCWHCGAERSAH